MTAVVGLYVIEEAAASASTKRKVFVESQQQWRSDILIADAMLEAADI